VKISPFRAYRFNPDVVAQPGKCIAPPYDVIDERQQQQLYDRSDYNIVRIIRGKNLKGDDEKENVYTRAADYLNSWIKQGALKQDNKPGMYGYVQNFSVGDAKYQRYAFIAEGKLEEFGKSVKAHENTLSKPKEDRLNLTRVTGARFGLVYMLYDDLEQVAEKIIEKALIGLPCVDFTDEEGTRHRLYQIDSAEETAAISKMMGDKSCIIADGHHRYETALNYAKESSNPAAGYQMMAFSNAAQPGMVVLATHRLVSNLQNFDTDHMLEQLGKNFRAERIETHDGDKDKAKEQMLAKMKAEYQKNNNAFGIYAGGDVFYVISLKDKLAMDSAAPGFSSAYKKLDVSVLHKLILENILSIDEKKLAGGEYIEYLKDSGGAVEDSIKLVDQGKKQVAFFMNPPKIEQIEKVAEQGEKMPQKSTFFYPKVYSGLAIDKL